MRTDGTQNVIFDLSGCALFMTSHPSIVRAQSSGDYFNQWSFAGATTNEERNGDALALSRPFSRSA
jgi:hypothetical protein